MILPWCGLCLQWTSGKFDVTEHLWRVLCTSVKLFELFAFGEKEKKEKCKKSKAGVFYGVHCKCKVLSAQNEYISLQRILGWASVKFFCHVNELLENEGKNLPSTSWIHRPVSVWSATGLARASLWAGLWLNSVNLSHRSLGGVTGVLSSKRSNKTWHFIVLSV